MTTCACRQHLNATLWGGVFSLTYFLTKYNKKTMGKGAAAILKTHQLYVKMTLRREVVQLPVLSIFYGIIVRMYREQGGKHNMPHIHAEYSGEEIVVALDGTVLEGSFPKNKLKLLEAWIVIHHEDLEANWKLLSNGEQFFRIDPLK